MSGGDLLSSGAPILAVMVSIGLLAGYMYKIGDWINKKAEHKASELKLVTETKARELKENTEGIARDMKDITEDVAEDIRKEAARTAESLKVLTDHVAGDIKVEAAKTADILKTVTEQREKKTQEYTDKSMGDLKIQISIVDTKVMETLKQQQEMLAGLTRRSDLVNGNIAAIRTDVADVSDDMDELYEKIRSVGAAGGIAADAGVERSYTRTRKKNMKEKRRRIESDRVNQAEK